MVVNLLNLTTTINYFTTFPLKTKTYYIYQKWLSIYHLVIKKQHLTESGLKQIRELLNH